MHIKCARAFPLLCKKYYYKYGFECFYSKGKCIKYLVIVVLCVWAFKEQNLLMRVHSKLRAQTFLNYYIPNHKCIILSIVSAQIYISFKFDVDHILMVK